MAVNSMEIGHWEGNRDKTSLVWNPTWDQVQQAIHSLDGLVWESVTLQLAGDSYMGIAGGEDGEYVVAGYLEEKGNFILVNKDAEPNAAKKVVTVGGQDSEYKADEIVSLEQAIAVARAFFDHGVCADSFAWKSRAAMSGDD